MPVLNEAFNLQIGGEQVLRVMHRGAEVWVLPVPVNTVAPVLSGGTSAPADLSVTNGTWTNSPDSYSYQLQEDDGGDWVDVVGETASTFDDLPAGTYSALVTATNEFGDSIAARSNSIIVTSGTLRTFGFTATVGSGDGFPGSPDRALASKFTKSHAGRVNKLQVRIRTDSAAGNVKLIACADDAGGSVPGTRLWISQPFAVSAGGGLIEPGLPTSGIEGTDAAADYWLIFVPDDYDVNVAKSNTLALGQTRMANGTYSYASPPSTWPGTDQTYDGPICAWAEYIG
ncbi:MAG TPA: fibronectin type III domain-containing protein [Pseudoxanthomonas sp.]